MRDAKFNPDQELTDYFIKGCMWVAGGMFIAYTIVMIYEFGYMRGEEKEAKKRFTLHKFPSPKEPSPSGR